jgi:hypothetical protein
MKLLIYFLMNVTGNNAKYFRVALNLCLDFCFSVLTCY